MGCLLALGLAKLGKQWYMTCRLSGEFIDSCALELGAKRHKIELPWERKGLKEILNPAPFSHLKIPLQSISTCWALCISSMLVQNCRR